jgi:hypothetical protein
MKNKIIVSFDGSIDTSDNEYKTFNKLFTKGKYCNACKKLLSWQYYKTHCKTITHKENINNKAMYDYTTESTETRDKST